MFQSRKIINDLINLIKLSEICTLRVYDYKVGCLFCKYKNEDFKTIIQNN